MNQLNILNILGSPRKNGTSARIAQAFATVAKQRGAQVSDYYLNGLQYRGCQGCEGCHTRSESCILRDDATTILEGLHTADIAIFSAPVYFGDTCGQFKLFYDRMWSLIRSDYAQQSDNISRLPAGKAAVLILSQADSRSSETEVTKRYTMYLEQYGFSVHPIMAAGLPLQPNCDINDYVCRAEELARELVA